MRCTQCQGQFTDYLEGSLTPQQGEQVAAHLDACSDCTAELEALRRTVAALHSLPAASPPENLLARINQAVAAQTVVGRSRISWQRISTVAVAATLLVGFWAVLSYQGVLPVAKSVGPTPSMPAPSSEALDQTAQLAKSEEFASPELAQAPEDRVTREPVPPSAPTPAAVGVRQPQPHRPARLEEQPLAIQPPPPPVAERELTTDAVSKSMVPEGANGAAEEMPAGGQAADAGPDLAPPLEPLGERRTLGPLYGATSTGAVVAEAKAGAKMIVTPPPLEQRTVGRPLDVQITIQPEADVKEAVVQVQPKGSLRLTEGKPIIYHGPLKAQESKHLVFGIIATASGAQELQVDLLSELPGVAASAQVTIPDFQPPPKHLTTQVFRDTPLDEALQAVAQEAKVEVIAGEGIGQEPISADFSTGVPAEAALRILADIADCQLQVEDETYYISRDAVDADGE